MVLQLRRPAAIGGVAAALLGAGFVTPAHALGLPVAAAVDVVDEAVVPGASVVTMVPVRILSDADVSPGTVRCIPVAGTNGIPAEATGVVVNVTSVRPNGVGYAVVFPGTSGGAPELPATSTVNFEPGQDVASSTFIALGPGGDLCYATRGATHGGLLLDVSGYVQEGSGVNLDTPQRLLDTRTPGNGGALAPGEARVLDVAGQVGVPADAESVLLNVTVADVSAAGNLRVYPGGPVTDTSLVNYAPGVDKANATVVALSDLGSVSLYSDSSRPVNVIVDVLGWTEAGGSHVGVDPTRVFDTRWDEPDAPAAPIEAGWVFSLPLADTVPANATAIVLNVTAIHPTTGGNLRVYPGQPEGTEPPNASSINYIPGRDIPNLVVVGLPADGYVDFYTDQPEGGAVDFAVDVVGYITD